MPKIEEIAAVMAEWAPPELAEEWDNVGTLVDCGGEVSSLLVSLDITPEVVAEAEAQSCQLIVAHHPVIFHPMRSIAKGDVVYRMVKRNISAICAHTNLDAAVGGVNDVLAALFGIAEPHAFAEGMGRIGLLRGPTTAAELADICVKRLGAHVRLVDAGKPVNTLAVVGGDGGDYVAEAALLGADCLLTGEAGHHDALDAAAAGLSLVVAGHFHTEFPVAPVLADRLGKRFPGLRVVVSRRNKDPFTYLG